MDSTDAALGRLWDVVAARLQRNGLRPTGSVRLDAVSHDERRALAGLLGRHVDAGTDAVTIDLQRLDERLRRARRTGLVDEAARLRGPLVDRVAVRSARAAEDLALWSAVRDQVTTSSLQRKPWIEAWLGAIRPVVLRAPTDARRALTETAIRCIDAVLAAGPGPHARTELASSLAGSAHALDDGRRLSVLVLRALALAWAVAYPDTPAQRRELWRSCGVLCDEISTTVLCAGLRPLGDDAAATLVRARADHSWATHLTMRDLDALRWDRPATVVSVCENPRVVERAIDVGIDAPIVCTLGNPTVVTHRLLTALATAGAELRYHGDFDWPGLAIANRVLGEAHAAPWRFSADDYRQAIAHAGALAVELPELGDRAVIASWDRTLTDIMIEVSRAVHEELVIDLLVADLRDAR